MSFKAPRIFISKTLTGKEQGECTDYTSATFIPRWNGIGTWQITLPGNSPSVPLLGPGSGLHVELPDGSIFTGSTSSYEDDWDTDTQPGGQVTRSGVSDNSILGNYICLPNPDADYTQQVATANWIYSGAAEDIVKQLVRENLATGVASRRLPGLRVMPSQGRGTTINASLRYQNLLLILQQWLTPMNIGFYLQSDREGGYEFDILPAVDVSNQVEFSRDLGNISGYSLSNGRPTVTRAIVAGQGEGMARNIRALYGPNSGLDPDWNVMVEQFIDQRQTNDNPTLDQAGTDALSQGAATPALTVKLVPDIPKQPVLGVDYGLGSKIAITLGDVTYKDVISQIQYDVQDGVVTVSPTIGDVDQVGGKAANLANIVQSIMNRIALLERST